MYKIGRQVEVSDRTTERAILSLLGPASAEIVGRATGAAAADAEHGWVEAEVASVTFRVAATAGGIDLLGPVAAADTLRTALVEAGAIEIADQAAEVAARGAGHSPPRRGHGPRQPPR